MRHLDLFSGIGGFALAAQMVWGDDYENIAFCDNNEFCQEVLAKNFPGCTIIGDVREVTRERIAANATGGRRGVGIAANNRPSGRAQHTLGDTVDLLTGGFPCQPFSCAGKRKGQADDRYLWPEMLRVISEFQPRWVLGENVAGIVEMALGQVQADLEAADYEVGSFVIPACAVNAPHRRDRVWIVARRNDDGWGDGLGQAQQPIQFRGCNTSKDAGSPRLPAAHGKEKQSQSGRGSEDTRHPDWQRDWREVAFATCVHRVDDGLPRRLVRLPSGRTISRARWRVEALKAYGNAIVPQVAAEIMLAIQRIAREGGLFSE